MLRLDRRGLASAGLERVRVVTSADELREARETVAAVSVSEEVAGYVLSIVRQTRSLPSVTLGASPRAAVHLLEAAKAVAAMAGRGYATPDDVARMAVPVLRHRLILSPEAELERYRPDDAVGTALSMVPVPR
jgi:MoxR-like ATPase